MAISFKSQCKARNSPRQFDLIYTWLTKDNVWLKERILASKSKTRNHFKKVKYLDLLLTVTDKKD